jgi:RNA polymerase sigma-70 factor, ECF subfamily
MKFINPAKNKAPKSDEELLKEFNSSGNLDILGELYSRYMHLVYGVCLKYLRDREESKDAVMQIFEKLVVEIPRHSIETFRNWLHVVTKNYCLMQLRSDKSQKEKLTEWINDSVVFMENSQIMHPIDEDGGTLEKGLADCIERLKGEQKECIRLFYFENRCYNEIALNLDLDEKKVKSHLQNAKRNLKLCLEEKHVRQE